MICTLVSAVFFTQLPQQLQMLRVAHSHPSVQDLCLDVVFINECFHAWDMGDPNLKGRKRKGNANMISGAPGIQTSQRHFKTVCLLFWKPSTRASIQEASEKNNVNDCADDCVGRCKLTIGSTKTVSPRLRTALA